MLNAGSLQWQARATALEPAGLVAMSQVAQQLVLRLQSWSEADLQRLSMLATPDMLVLLGPPAILPWADGVAYCAPDPLASALWLPTHIMPSLSSDLLQGAVARRLAVQGEAGPCLLWYAPEQILPLAGAINLNHSLLQWLKQVLA